MADLQEFRTAKLTFDSGNLAFIVEAKIIEKWETLTVPVYRDEPALRTFPTVKRIVAKLRRRYQSESPLHAALNGSSVTLEFESGGETIEFSSARVIQWEVSGKLGGEMMEEVELALENES
jgi:hypothetical protein